MTKTTGAIIKRGLPRALGFILLFTVICGVLYTAAVTGIAQIFFPAKAGGSLITIEGTTYGSQFLGQQFTDQSHMWGRPMKVDTATFTNQQGSPLMYAAPSNLSPASHDYEQLIAKRIAALKAAHPDQANQAIPVDLVTGSGSGLDPEISPAAAAYQIERLAKNNNISTQEVAQIIDQCTTQRFLGIFGEPRVNVLKVNLMLDKILH